MKILLKFMVKMLIMSAFIMLIASCVNDDSTPVSVDASSVTFDKTILTLAVGDSDTLTATILPENVSDTSLTWNSTATNIANVDANGIVKAFAIGSATISASAANGMAATCVVTVEPSIYVAGHENNIATIWKNGKVLYQFSDAAHYSCAYSVFVSGNDVYAAGEERPAEDVGNGLIYVGIPVARVWKNGAVQNLDSSDEGDIAYSVYVSGNDVYAAGYKYMLHKCGAIIWKNGVAQEFSNTAGSVLAYSVHVSGNDVYAAGTELLTATVWKNGVSQQLTDGAKGAAAYSVYVSGNDVYVAGYERNDMEKRVATVWKNGSGSAMSFSGKAGSVSLSESEIHSVFVSGNDVYAAGYERSENGLEVAKVWKNGEITTLTGSAGYTRAESVFVFGNDVYVVGHKNTTAIIWKNGAEQELSNSAYDSEAYSVFVK
jgi:hypothetical protein